MNYQAENSLHVLPVPEGVLYVRALSPYVINIKVLPDGATSNYQSVTMLNSFPTKTTLIQKGNELFFSTGLVTAAIDNASGRIRFLDANRKEILAEAVGGRKFTKNVVCGEDSYTPEQTFLLPEGESLYGLGQHQDGRLDWRGETLRLWQGNMDIAATFLWSTNGYGFLWDNPSITWFNPGEEVLLKDNKSIVRVSESGEYSLWLNHADGAGCWDGSPRQNTIIVDGKPVVDLQGWAMPGGAGCSLKLEANRDYAAEVIGLGKLQLMIHKKTPTTTWRSEVGEAVDYYVVQGDTPSKIMANYRAVSGHVPLLPKYAWGFWQCRERYHSSQELIEAVDGFRQRNIPVDIIVQDWQWWKQEKDAWYSPLWNSLVWDECFYPDVPGFTKTLHEKNTRLIVTVWPNFGSLTEVRKELTEAGGMIGNSDWMDPTNPKTREIYWKYVKKNLADQGVDGYWQDATEPECRDNCLHDGQLYLGSGARYLNSYPLFATRALYEGNRAATHDTRRLCDLTRSGYAGMQRYGVISWSGDITGTWEFFRHQIPAGLGYTSAGLPYWTTDTGGFFRPGSPTGLPGDQYTTPDHLERLCRWLQCETFFPVQRMHGANTHTEPWHYGPAEPVLTQYIKFRYRFLPYIYSYGWQIHQGGTLMKPMVMDFPQEMSLRNITDQFMFGDALLVAPIVEPSNSDEATNIAATTTVITLSAKAFASTPTPSFAGPAIRSVILPKAAKWYEFWSGKPVSNGTVTVSAPIDTIPLFVKAGSILPFGPELQHTEEKSDKPTELRVYPGADCAFLLYDDAGEGYNYEHGEYATVELAWDDQDQTLTIGDRLGSFPGMATTHAFLVRILQPDCTWKETPVAYGGKRQTVK